MKISKTPSLLIALTLSSMIAGGCATDDTEADPETDEDAEIEEPVGDVDGEFEGAARALEHSCGTTKCMIRLNRTWTRKAGNVAAIPEIARTACGKQTPRAAVAYCERAVTDARKSLAGNAITYYNEDNCLGIQYKRFKQGAPATLAVAVRVKAGRNNCQ